MPFVSGNGLAALGQEEEGIGGVGNNGDQDGGITAMIAFETTSGHSSEALFDPLLPGVHPFQLSERDRRLLVSGPAQS